MRTTCPAAGTRVVVLDDAGKRTSPDVDRRSVYTSRATALIPNQANRAELTGSSTTSKYWAHLTEAVTHRTQEIGGSSPPSSISEACEGGEDDREPPEQKCRARRKSRITRFECSQPIARAAAMSGHLRLPGDARASAGDLASSTRSVRPQRAISLALAIGTGPCQSPSARLVQALGSPVLLMSAVGTA
jgi:hypothetical protein